MDKFKNNQKLYFNGIMLGQKMVNERVKIFEVLGYGRYAIIDKYRYIYKVEENTLSEKKCKDNQ